MALVGDGVPVSASDRAGDGVGVTSEGPATTPTIVSAMTASTTTATSVLTLTGGHASVRYAAVGGPNQVVSASASPGSVPSPTHAT